MYPNTVDRLLSMLSDLAAQIDVDLDIRDRKRFVFHARQRETVLAKLSGAVELALKGPVILG